MSKFPDEGDDQHGDSKVDEVQEKADFQKVRHGISEEAFSNKGLDKDALPAGAENKQVALIAGGVVEDGKRKRNKEGPLPNRNHEAGT